MRMRTVVHAVWVASVVLVSTSCGDVARTGRSPMYLIMDSLLGARGASTVGEFGTPLSSDVITNTVTFADLGQVTLRVAPKDVTSLVSPTTNNDVTVTRYHVSYHRSDGRNVEGLDVPFAFDGAVTGTIAAAGGTSTLTFELVRAVAKRETPLVNLASSQTVVTTIADVTFYGRDQAGNDVAVTGLIQIDFGNFGD
jgi:hypothetical protein